MYDPVPAPARRAPTGAGVIVLRVVLPLVAVASIGLLSCVPLFRAAFVRGRWYDWLAAWLSIPVTVLGFGLTAALPRVRVPRRLQRHVKRRPARRARPAGGWAGTRTRGPGAPAPPGTAPG